MGRRFEPYLLDPLEILDAASDGRGVARHEGRVIFVPFSVPGDKGAVWVSRREKKMHSGDWKNITQPSADRVEARCQHFGLCGGCKWQMMRYEAQLRYKQKQVTDAMERIGKVVPLKSIPILPSEAEYHYRNKLEFSFSEKQWLTRKEIESGVQFPDGALGFHVPGVFDKVLPITECHLQVPLVNQIRNHVKAYAIREGLSFHNIRDHTGFLRNLAFRTSLHTGELMVVLIVYEDKPEIVASLFSDLESTFKEITDLVWIHNPKMNNSYSDLESRVWKGKDYITERLGGFDFRISPTSFFQTNPSQAERLYGVVRRMAAASLPEGKSRFPLVWDLYSGTGSIGIYVSDLAEKILGIEYVETAIADARLNAELNGLDHFTFYAGDIRRLLSADEILRQGKPDLVIADPPRAGMEAKVVNRLLEIEPATIVYVSCKPATQARDIQLMVDKYELAEIQPVDMFPHTAHVENVALLKKRAT